MKNFSHFEFKSVEHWEWLGKIASESNQNKQIRKLIENLAAPNTFFPTFTEENKILASFPSVKLEFRRC